VFILNRQRGDVVRVVRSFKTNPNRSHNQFLCTHAAGLSCVFDFYNPRARVTFFVVRQGKMDLYSEVADVPIDDVESAVEKVDEGDETNGNNPILASSSTVDERITRRAKRPSKYLVKHLSKEGSSSPNGGQNGGAEGTSLLVNGIRTAKNLRRPRNGYGRGLPKKGKFGFISIIIRSVIA
jgi:hypothetical protein